MLEISQTCSIVSFHIRQVSGCVPFVASSPILIFSHPRCDRCILICLEFLLYPTNQVVPHVFGIFCFIHEQSFQGCGHTRTQHIIHKRPAHGIHFGASAAPGPRFRFPRHLGYPEDCRCGRQRSRHFLHRRRVLGSDGMPRKAPN